MRIENEIEGESLRRLHHAQAAAIERLGEPSRRIDAL